MQKQKILREAAERIVNPKPFKKTLNLHSILRTRIEKEGLSTAEADELAELWKDDFQEQISKQMEGWHAFGIPSPIAIVNAPNTIVTYKHQKYKEITESPLAVNYHGIFDLVLNLEHPTFLVIPVLLLYMAGCNPIYITDSPGGDGGVDCIGRLSHGPLRSLCIFAQAKVSTNLVAKEHLQLEHKKFCDLFEDKPHHLQKYRSALRMEDSSDGISICYALVTNSEFSKSAIDYAAQKNIMLRSKYQIAHWLSQRYLQEDLERFIDRNTSQIGRNLNFNWFDIVRQDFGQ